jgi:hypothetical protein
MHTKFGQKTGWERRLGSEDLGIDRWIILEWILEKWDRKLCIGFIWLRTGTSGE